MMASLTVHDKKSGDEPFAEGLKLIEKHAGDERHWVKLAVNWALRSVGKRSKALHSAAVALAQKLAASENCRHSLDRQGRVAGIPGRIRG